jgi:hypothetical protein
MVLIDSRLKTENSIVRSSERPEEVVCAAMLMLSNKKASTEFKFIALLSNLAKEIIVEKSGVNQP